MEDVPASQDSAPLDLLPPDHTMPRRHIESFDGYSEESDTCCPLAEVLEQFWQLQDQFAHLKSAVHPPTHMLEVRQLTDKLQQPTMMLQPHPNPQPQLGTNGQNYAGIHGHLVHCTERGKPHHDLAAGYSHI